MADNPYVKIFRSMLFSSVWINETSDTRVLWVTMLDLKDSHGEIRASVPGLAHAAVISIEACEEGLRRLSSPDPYSESPEEEGRRIIRMDGGWRVVNADKYRDMGSDERTKKQTAERVRRHRANSNACNADVTLQSVTVTDVTVGNAVKPHTDPDPDPNKINTIQSTVPPVDNDVEHMERIKETLSQHLSIDCSQRNARQRNE